MLEKVQADRPADQRRDHSPGKLARREQEARQEVGQHQEGGPAEERGRQQQSVVRSEDHAQHVGHHQADESDHARHGHRDGGIPGVEFQRNAFNTINAASGATGGGMGTNLYAGGVFELEPDEALIVENRVDLEPQYIGFQLGNLWGESLEYAHALGSLNGSQSERGPDGVIRLVVAHRDPGVQNWLDTRGHREGFLTPRWAYSETPPSDRWPQITAKKVAFDEIGKHLPEGTRAISPEERREQIRVREEHVQRRFRVF